MRADGARHELVQPVGVVQPRTVDVDCGPLRGVYCREDDVGGILASAYDHVGVGDYVCVKLVDAHVAYVHIGDEVGHRLVLGLANVVLELGEQRYCGHGRHVVEHLGFPAYGAYRPCRRLYGGGEHFHHGFAFFRIGYVGGDEVAVFIHRLAQLASFVGGRIEHDH